MTKKIHHLVAALVIMYLYRTFWEFEWESITLNGVLYRKYGNIVWITPSEILHSTVFGDHAMWQQCGSGVEDRGTVFWKCVWCVHVCGPRLWSVEKEAEYTAYDMTMGNSHRGTAFWAFSNSARFEAYVKYIWSIFEAYWSLIFTHCGLHSPLDWLSQWFALETQAAEAVPSADTLGMMWTMIEKWKMWRFVVDIQKAKASWARYNF